MREHCKTPAVLNTVLLVALYCATCFKQVDLLNEAVKRMHASLTERVASGKSPLSPQDIDHGTYSYAYIIRYLQYSVVSTISSTSSLSLSLFCSGAAPVTTCKPKHTCLKLNLAL
jgi:hypothetical protein